MEKKNLDWENIGFAYHQTDMRYVANYKNGAWDEGGLTADANVVISECAGILQYCQEVFEGLKVYETKDGNIVAFRPDQNAERMINSAKGMEMPPFPKERFLDALDQVVKANAAWVPPYGKRRFSLHQAVYVCFYTCDRSKTSRRIPVPHSVYTCRPIF